MRLYDLITNTPGVTLPDGLTRNQLESLQKTVRGYTLGPGIHLGVGACLAQVDLQGMNLRWADLLGSNLRGANLQDADLRGANLGLTHIEEANFSDADLRGTNLAVWPFENASFCGALYDGTTQFPRDFDPTAWGMVAAE